jgi:hypothetical protein
MGVEFGPVVRCDANGCRNALPLASGEDAFAVVSGEDGWRWSRSIGYLCPNHAETARQGRIACSSAPSRGARHP